MKEQINKCLLEAWDSSLKGVNTTKATEKLVELFDSELDKQAYRIVSLKTELKATEDELLNSNNLLNEARLYLTTYRNTQSNNPRLLHNLDSLIKDIEEQIDNE